MNHHPPRWINQFLEWYCNPDLLEEIQGDLHELYQRRISTEGKSVANRKFLWDVIRFFRWSNIKRSQKNYSSNSFIMFKSYFKLGFRNAIRNGLTSSINLVGLSIALGMAISIFTFIDYMFNQDTFHINRDRIYQITNFVKDEAGNANDNNWSDSPLLLAPMLKEDNPAIESVARVEFENGAMRYNETVFNESIWFVDADFLKIFSFPILYGNYKALENPSELVISKKISEKYFGNINPVGQTFSIKFSNGKKEEFTVGAVIDLPSNSSIRFDNLLSMHAFENLKLKDSYDWSFFTDATFVMLKPGHTISEVENGMKKYKDLQNAASLDWPIQNFKFYSLIGLSRKNEEINQEICQGAHPAGMIALGTISFLLLLLACFNYMNIAVATVTTRLKEIGIRKVVGGRKKEIITQFLIENFVLCAVALLVGVLIAHLFFIPGLTSLFPISFSLADARLVDLLVFFLSILFLVGVISGAYPALYISGFQPVSILRGKEKFGQKSLFSKSLLTIQFMLAFTTLIGCFVFIANSLSLKNKDWGYEHEQNYVVPVLNHENYVNMRDRVAQNKNILSYAGSNSNIGDRAFSTSITHLDEKVSVVSYEVGFNYLETMNLRLKEGRFFDEAIQSDKTESAVISETFAKEMGWEHPIGQSFEYDSTKRFVIGVTEKFHYDDFYASVDPVLFTITPEENFKYIVMKVQAGAMMETENFLKESWHAVDADDPYEGYFQDSVFEGFQRDNNGNMKLLAFVSGVTILLASMGLFGLVSYNITRRMKEFSVRKVFGASVNHIFKLMNRDYAWILIIAFVVGAPLGFFSINSLIQIIYPDPIPTNATPFVLGIVIMVVTVLATVSLQIRRIVKNNPAQTLRND